MQKLYIAIKSLQRKAKARSAQQSLYPQLVEVVVEALLAKKAENVVSIDLRQLPEAVTQYFVICDCSSTTQVRAVALGVEEAVEKKLGEEPWHVEGIEHLQWVLLDYVDVVVHIFLTPMRHFYQLEELWSDGQLVEHSA